MAVTKGQPTAIPIQEVNKNLQKEISEKQQAMDDYSIKKYLYDQAKVDTEKSTLFDKTLGTPIRALKDLASPITMDESSYVKDEKGNKVFLPTYNELKQEKVRNDTKGLLGFGQDIVYSGTKILGASALDAATLGVGGKALYWTDMATDNYKNVINQGYSKEQAFLNAAINTGSEFLTEKLLGGFSRKLTGGEASQLENVFANKLTKLTRNPKISRLIGSMGSEGVEEFTQEFLSALYDKITLGEDKDIDKLVEDAFYSGLIGAGTSGFVNVASGNREGKAAQLNTDYINSRIDKMESLKENTSSKNIKTKLDETINKAQEYVNAPFGKDVNKVSEELDASDREIAPMLKAEETAKIREKQQNNINTLPQVENVAEQPKTIEKTTPQQVTTKTVDTVPEGWIKTEGATTAPKGYTWYNNGKSRFGGEYQNVLVKDTATQPATQEVTQKITPQQSLSEVRNFEDMGNKKINAYQYDNPEVKPYFQQTAKEMLTDLKDATKAERYMTEDGEFGGVKRNVVSDIAELLDGENGVKYSYKQIEDGLNAIIEDNGAENKAVAKRIEFYLDQRLRNGYKDSLGYDIPANKDYLSMLENNQRNTQYKERLLRITKNMAEGTELTKEQFLNKWYDKKTYDELGLSKSDIESIYDNANKKVKTTNLAEKTENIDKRLEKYKYNNLTVEQKNKIIELKNSLERANQAVDKMFANDKKQAEKVKYGQIMQTEAQIREIIQGDSFDLIENGLTSNELQKKLDKENSNYIGKPVLVDGQKGKILSSTYGNYKIQLDNGDVVTKKKDGFEALNKVPKNVSEVNRVTFKPNESTQQNLKSNTQVDTGVSIGNKPVTMKIPADSKPNKLGQYIPKNGFSKIEKGKIGDSNFYKNVTERADFIKNEVREKIKNDNSIKHYKKVTNEESMQMAFDDLNTRGTEAIADFFNNNKELTSKDTAMGWLLIEQSQENGDYDFSNQVLRKMRSNATKLGQAEQMYNYYARLTPEGMYRWCGDQLLRAEEIFEKNKTKKWIENNKDRWQLNGEETEFIKSQMEKVQKLNQMNDNDTATIEVKGKQKQVSVERAKQVEIAKVQAMIENKLPPEKGQALNAWMRIAMLGNLKTIGTRNPLGNAALRPINDVGDFFASLADVAISKKTGVRTKGNLNLKAQLKGAKQGGSNSIQDFLIGIDTKNPKGNRFEVGSGKSFNERHQGIGKVLNPLAKLGNKADSYVSFLLDLGDRPFYNAAYRQSLENQMKLNKIDNVDNIPDWIKNNAEQEALERTYQDDNNYTSAVVDIRKAMNKFNVKGYGLGDVIIPFAKTPANITKAIVDYSPAGFVSALTKGNQLRKAINNGQFTPEMQHTFVNQLGKATAGTILYAIGAALANSGVITGGADEDKDVADFMRNTLGIQPYSIKIGDKTFTYDWAQPVASGFAIPADIKKSIDDAKNGEVDLEYIIHKSFSTAGSILLEQSFLQGIKDVLGGYGDPLDNLMSEIEGLPARAIPTLFQQITTYLDSTKRMSYGNEGLKNVKSQAIAKTPFAKSLPVYRNSMGKEIKMYGGKNTFFNVFLNPANYSEGNASDSAKEIYRVYQATNDKTILPRLVDSSMKNEDGTKLTNQQKSNFLKISGNIIEKNVAELLNDKEYNNMSDEDKAQVIKSIVDYGYNKARKEITGHKLSSAYSKAEQAENSGYAIADYYISKKVNKKTKTSTSNNNNRYQELADKGISGRVYDDFKAFVSTAKGESNSGGLSKKEKIINYIENLPLTEQQKQTLYQDYIDNQGIFTYYK